MHVAIESNTQGNRSSAPDLENTPSAPVPLLSPQTLLAQDPTLAAAMQARAAEVLLGGQYIMGGDVEAFERAAAPWLHARHGVGVTSGSDALLLAMAALGVGPGDQVVVPSYTFVASAGSVARLGARPRFVDSCPACLTLLPAHANCVVNAQTRAVMPVHLFGQAAAMGAVRELAARHALGVVEDAAQAFGLPADALNPPRPRAPALATQQGAPWLRATSFFPSKNLGACGDAGLVACDDDALAERLRVLRVHGSPGRYVHTEISGNFRLDGLQAALLLVKLPGLNRALQQRRANAARYDALFAQAGAADATTRAPCACEAPDHAEAQKMLEAWRRTRGPQALALPFAAARTGGDHHTFNQYVVQLRDAATRARVQGVLEARGIGCAIYYPTPLHLQPCFAHLGHRPGDLPIAEHAAATTLALPIAEHLTAAQQGRVVQAVLAGLRQVA